MNTLDWNRFFVVFALLLLTGNMLKAQDCTISIDTDIPVCRYQTFELSVPACGTCSFEWKKDDVKIGGSTSSILVSILDQTLFTVTVTDENTGQSCSSDSFLVTTLPEIYTELEQLQLTCTNGDNDNGNTAKVRAKASGEYEPDEYHYFWDVKPIQIAPGDSSVALGLKAHQYYSITVKDDHGCFEKDTIWTKAYYNPDVELFADPDTAFVQRPHIEFSFINNSVDTIPLSNFFWNFNDDKDTANSFLPTPTHSFILNDKEIEDGGKDYLVMFTALNPEGCDTIFTHTVKVRPLKLDIPNVFTPNGDGINDVFRITEPQSGQGDAGGTFKAKDTDGFYTVNHYYESTKLVVFNRQGRVIFRSEDYQSDWDGDNLPEGVYYYVLKATGPRGTEIYKGSVSIIRGSN
ncbi:MAG: gliding motility-associated C-terminal domain-containing protein [Chlorobi bacterium]|nr:gliding motility-associated C-terminal domain-containing protein [Chlorobiota bacterium]